MRALLDLVLPTFCVGCGAPGGLSCRGCAATVAGRGRLVWPTPTPVGLPAPYAVARYAGTPRAMLLAYKEDGAAPLRHPLGAALASAVAAGLPPGTREVHLVPVPSSAAARRRRGDDVVLVPARRAAACLRRSGVVARVVPALRLTRRVADSAGLTASQRADNLADAVTARAAAARRLAGSEVVVVDDIITTGATLAECARALLAAGVPVTAVATVAATRRAGPPASTAPSAPCP